MGLPSDLIADAEGVADQEVYPDVWPALDMLIDMQTQWRVGAAGATGMDYTALETLMRVKRVKNADRSDLLGDVRRMESAVLELWREQRGK
jgi:hypothetical protein